MKAVIVSLKKDIIRRTSIENKLKNFDYKFSIFDAIDKSSSSTAAAALGVRHIPKHMTPGEIGCALSHLSLYERNTDEHLLVLEDDVVPLTENPFDQESLLPALRDGEVLILGVITKREWLGYRKTVKRLGIECMQLDYCSTLMLRGAFAYIVNARTAQSLAKLQKESLSVADAWSYFKKCQVLNSFILAEIFEHPVTTTTQSNLETERQLKKLKFRALRRLARIVALHTLRTLRVLFGAKNVQKRI
ncbi:MAG: glycosyltransferase family 25 protein [Pseudomonadota bacterium]